MLKAIVRQHRPCASYYRGDIANRRLSRATVTAAEDVVDITEYFGSEDFADARLVRYMQLKHSTLHAHQPANGGEKSITGFAERYRELLKTFAEDAWLRNYGGLGWTKLETAELHSQGPKEEDGGQRICPPGRVLGPSKCLTQEPKSPSETNRRKNLEKSM
ncbi:hypothetical protein [Rhizobium mongolense]|uniref:hypothetical protein n=1 Tax=Rhizobium mongolense TaxID=57676 RepID=UPI001113B122|nr:hypothetical protein [Rhizobium mongolense]